MTDSCRCPQCGLELSADAPGGLCPGCLLKQGFESSPERLAETAARSLRFTAPPPGELDQLFPQLEVLGLLGQGGMGAVYQARQPTLDRLVALKILPAEVGHDPAFAERFAREARALARLSHPNIVAIYDFGQLDGLYYFVMEYVDGLSLRQLVESRQLSPTQALALVPQICEALQFAHDEGIVHRDVKPENILLDKRGRVKIADFGLAKLLGRASDEATLTRLEQVMGTPLYMAPEQMQGSHAVDHRADIYSLGVVFYEMLTGELPLGRFAPPSQKVQIDVRLDEVVLRTLEREPDRRYQHASDVKTEVESIVGRTTPAGTPPLPPLGDSDEELVVRALRRTKNRIHAIRLYRDLTGAGLAAAVTAIEAIAKRNDIELKALTQHERAAQIGVASLLLIAAVYFASESSLMASAKGAIIFGGGLLYVAFVAAHAIGARKDRLQGGISLPWRRCANTHAWVVAIGLLGMASSVLPWGKVAWYGPDPAGEPGAASRWNERLVYGWQSWKGKTAMAVFLVLALLRLASGFSTRPRWWQAASLLIGAIAILALCYPNPPPQLPDFLANLVRVELHSGLAVPVTLAVALLMIAAIELRMARADGNAKLRLTAFFARLVHLRPARKGLQCLLIFTWLLCFIIFFGAHIGGRQGDDGHWQFECEVGSFTPWFYFQTWPEPNVPFRYGVVLCSTWLFAILAFAVSYAAWRLEKAVRPEAGFWTCSPSLVAIFWGLCMMFLVAYGMWMGFRSLDANGPAP